MVIVDWGWGVGGEGMIKGGDGGEGKVRGENGIYDSIHRLCAYFHLPHTPPPSPFTTREFPLLTSPSQPLNYPSPPYSYPTATLSGDRAQ